MSLIKEKTHVIKRDGRKEDVFPDKITSRIEKLCYGLNDDYVDPFQITLKVVKGLYPGVTTVELDNIAAETAATKIIDHPHYGILAARIAVSNLHKQTKKHFSEVMDDLYKASCVTSNKPTPLISEKHHNIIMRNADRLNSCIIYDRDYSYNYFGFKTLENTYLLKINGKVVERPQHMLMRVAVGIHGDDVDAAIETYNYMSLKYFIHSSPTLFHAATPNPQLSSSFLVMMPDDSLSGIMECLTRCATISKSTGGVGVNVHNIRAKGTPILGTNGLSNGLVPMLKVFNSVAVFAAQRGRGEPGAFAVYLEPWHPDVLPFLNLKKGAGANDFRARDLFLAMWIPDLFMRRVEADEDWSLMCPRKSPGLSDCWGEEFEKLYTKYEEENIIVSRIPARKLWQAITTSQAETGVPYMLYKDSCNRKSNQKNLGTIKGGNLCAEVVEFTSADEIAACCSASIAVNMFVTEKGTYDFAKLKEVVKVVTRNLNKIIDVTDYPRPEARNSNAKHRPIGIGVQGLADAFFAMKIPYDGEQAKRLNRQIYETLYYAALEASCELAEADGPYPSYNGSPVSAGVLQYDMWDVTPSELWDWAALKARIATHGVRNSLLTASMPTSTTAKIFGNNESFEPCTSNVHAVKVLSKEFQVINHYLIDDLAQLNLWNNVTKTQILESGGSIQNVPGIPDKLKEIYKTVWEISNRVIIDYAADRGAFIDQSQSLNIYVEKPTYPVLSTIHFMGWRKGLKTGMYCLKTKQAAKKTQPVVEKKEEEEVVEEEEDPRLVCSRLNPENCVMCGS